MATQKPISTISYNTLAFLEEKLKIWYSSHLIQAYQFIQHMGEDGDKDHIHLRIEPNKKLDPMELTELLKEYVPGSDKPLCVRPWRPSKEEDWYMYAVHDPEYLNLKYGGGEKGEKLPYTIDDVHVSDDYDKEIAFIRAKSKLRHTTSNLAKQFQNGKSAFEMIAEGENVFTVNAIQRLMYNNDYSRLAESHQKLLDDLDKAGIHWIEAERKLVSYDGWELTALNNDDLFDDDMQRPGIGGLDVPGTGHGKE